MKYGIDMLLGKACERVEYKPLVLSLANGLPAERKSAGEGVEVEGRRPNEP